MMSRPPVVPSDSLPERNPNYVICIACGSQNPVGMKYCGNCKAELHPSSAVVQSLQKTGSSLSLRMCDGCDNLIDRNFMACPRCGRDYSSPQYHATKVDVARQRGNLTAIPIIGLLISLISAFLGIVAVFYAYSLLPSGYSFLGWFSLLLIFVLICGIISIPLSLYAIARCKLDFAIAGSILSIIAGWALLGIFTMTVALFGLILIVIGRDDFAVPDKTTKSEPQSLEDW